MNIDGLIARLGKRRTSIDRANQEREQARLMLIHSSRALLTAREWIAEFKCSTDDQAVRRGLMLLAIDKFFDDDWKPEAER